MLQKFALAFKSKTIEFFAEDEEEDDLDYLTIPALDLDPAPEEIITGQHVVVLKPDPPDAQTLIPSLLAALSSFRAAYLNLQTAHSPFDPDSIRLADRLAVSHICRLSDLKTAFHGQNPKPLSSILDSQVQDNQTLLRAFENVVNALQSDIDSKDAEAAALKKTLSSMEASNSKLARRLDRACLPADDRVETLLSVSVFDSVLKESCRATHSFTRVLVDLLKSSDWDLSSAVNSIYPDINYAKPGHCRYAILSYVCLRMFEGFDSDDFGCQEGSNGMCTMDALRQFIEHSAADPLELMSRETSCGFTVFCKKKYQELVNGGLESSLWNLDHRESILQPSSPLYEPFISMASSVWTLNKLAWAYNPVVGVFLVGRGEEFSMVYMESIVRSSAPMSLDRRKIPRMKVGFTVIPGFRVGKTVIQSRVYLDGL